MRVRKLCRLAPCLLLIHALTAQAIDPVVLKEGAGLTVGGALDPAFGSVTTGNIVPQTVNDTYISLNPAAPYTLYGNQGTSSGNLLLKFDLSSLGYHATIYKAQLRLRATYGSSAVTLAHLTTHDWLETTACLAGPDAPASPNKTWGPASDSFFSAADYGTPAGFESSPAGAAWLVKDVTADVQAFVDGTLPNYGWYASSGNRAIVMSEHLYDGERPALFISYEPGPLPLPINNVAVAGVDWFKVDLRWTAPSDLPSGPVARYDVRYSTSPITDMASFWAATPATAPAPVTPGTIQTAGVTGLTRNTEYWFAVVYYDHHGQMSVLSNVVNARTLPCDCTPPGAVGDLAATEVRPSIIKLRWTAAGDDGQVGQATVYDLRYSLNPIVTEADFAAATAVPGVPAPQAAGSAETFTLHALDDATTYHLAIKVGDEDGEWSAISNVVTVTTPACDCKEPFPVTDLRWVGAHPGTVYLMWTAPSSATGTNVAGYEMRYSTTPIDESRWAAATVVPNTPAPAIPGSDEHFTLNGLAAGTTCYIAIKSFNFDDPPYWSPLSNVIYVRTPTPVVPVTVHNPWIVSDRVADTRNISTMAATYVNAYTPGGVVLPASNEDRAINIYNNQKRRLYHWSDEPPAAGGNDINDPTYNQNVFGWAMAGRHVSQACTLAQAAGLGQRKISLPGHYIYEVQYGGDWHAFDTMTTMYVFNRLIPRSVAGCQQLKTDSTILGSAVADGRACPGFLLCGDPASWLQDAMNLWTDSGSAAVATSWTGQMDLREGQAFERTWESWQNQHPAAKFNYDSMPGNDPPYHHESQFDWKDTVNFPYWEPYGQVIPYIHSSKATYRRWANGTDTLAPDFANTGCYALLEPASHDIAIRCSDGLSPDLHAAAVGATGEAIFKVAIPYYITDGSFSGQFVRTNPNDVCRVFFSSTGTTWTQIYDAPIGTTHVSNQNIRTSVFGLWQTYYIRIQVKATSAKSDAGVSNFVLTTTFEHNKGAMPYLDKGTNTLTLTFDDATGLQASDAYVRVVYRWKEYDGTGWTISREAEIRANTSPRTFTIVTGGSKVPRTESIRMDIVRGWRPWIPPIQDLAAGVVMSDRVPLTWTAVGDGYGGTATSYDLRYSTSPITDDASFAAATPAAGVPAPGPQGSPESFTVLGLLPGTTYWFAIKASNWLGYQSELSNVVMIATPEPCCRPLWVGDLVARPSAFAGAADLTWTAPPAYGYENSGPYPCLEYDLRCSTSPIPYDDDTVWNEATHVVGLPAPGEPGAAETFTVSGLIPGTQYYFAIRAMNDVHDWSEISNCAASKASVIGRVTLQMGRNGYTGCSDSYIWAAMATNNYGNYERMTVSGYKDQDVLNPQRGLVRFDLAGIPAGAAITSATLSLYSYDTLQAKGSSGSYGLHPVSREWTDMGVTWSNATSGDAWTSGGGDFAATPDATATKKAPAAVPCWYDWDVTARVQTWLAGTSDNYGWIIKCTDEYLHNQDRFYQSGAPYPACRPTLVISDLVAPVPGDINGDGVVDVIDLLSLAGAWGSTCGTDRNHDPLCDLNADGTVDVLDLLTLADHWPR